MRSTLRSRLRGGDHVTPPRRQRPPHIKVLRGCVLRLQIILSSLPLILPVEEYCNSVYVKWWAKRAISEYVFIMRPVLYGERLLLGFIGLCFWRMEWGGGELVRNESNKVSCGHFSFRFSWGGVVLTKTYIPSSSQVLKLCFVSGRQKNCFECISSTRKTFAKLKGLIPML